MKKKRQALCLLWSLNLMALIFQLTSVPVYAGDAVADILNNERFQGAIDTIEWLTTKIDFWFTMAITLTAFFIISTALLKNVLAGAYCANTKFWDKVAEAHQNSEATAFVQRFTGLNPKNMSSASLKDTILSIVPNIKAMTDFDENELDAKAYWMRAIPQMLGCVIIGVFIYNGHYRDTAVLVGSFGSEICNRVFASVDPVTFLDTVSQTTSTPDNIFKNDPSIQGQIEYAISFDLYKKALADSEGASDFNFKTSLMRDAEAATHAHIKSLFIDSDVNSAKYNLFGTGDNAREYDYSVSGLSITLLGKDDTMASQLIESGTKGDDNLNMLSKVEEATPDDKSVLNVTVYMQALPSASPYTSNAGYYITYQLKGVESDGTSVKGTSSAVPQYGSWAGTKMSPYTIKATGVTWTGSGDNRTVKGGYITVNIDNADLLSEITTQIDKDKKADAKSKVPEGLEIIDVTVNGYSKKDAKGNYLLSAQGFKPSKTYNTSAEFSVTCVDSEGNNYRYKLPIKVQMPD